MPAKSSTHFTRSASALTHSFAGPLIRDDEGPLPNGCPSRCGSGHDLGALDVAVAVLALALALRQRW
jgi:hypothetical protein